MRCPACGASVAGGTRSGSPCEYCGTALPPPEPAPEESSAGGGGLLADRDGDGIPDVLQRAGGVTGTTSTVYEVDGVTHHSLEEMPPDVRAMVEHALAHSAATGPAPTARPEGRHPRPTGPSAAGCGASGLITTAALLALAAYLAAA